MLGQYLLGRYFINGDEPAGSELDLTVKVNLLNLAQIVITVLLVDIFD